MDTNEYHTVKYQRGRMWGSLAFAGICLVGLLLICWIDPESFMGYILAFGVIIGVYGFFDHRKYMRELKSRVKTAGGVYSEGSHITGP